MIKREANNVAEKSLFHTSLDKAKKGKTMKKYEQFEKIILNLSILRYMISSKVSNGFYDINKQCEPFFMEILNILYGWKLVKAREVNHPGIDLFDDINKIAIQVTSQKSLSKVEKTIAIFDEKQYSTKYNRLIVLNVLAKANHSKEIKAKSITFDQDSDIIDVEDLIKEIEKCSDEKFERIFAYIDGQLGSFIKANIDRSSLLVKDRPDYQNSEAVNYNKVKKYMTSNRIDLKEFDEFKAEATKKHSQLLGLSQKQRQAIFVTISKGTLSKIRLLTLGEILENSFGYSRPDVGNTLQILQRENILWDDENSELSERTVTASNEWFWGYAKEILQNEDLHSLIIDLKFIVFDD